MSCYRFLAFDWRVFGGFGLRNCGPCGNGQVGQIYWFVGPVKSMMPDLFDRRCGSSNNSMVFASSA
ncbi:unnamed protein product [Arabidopsis halleri]